MAGAHIPVVIDIVCENSEIPSALLRQITHAVGNPRGDAHGTVRKDSQIQQTVAHAAGENGAVGAALQCKSKFHFVFPLSRVGR